MLRLIDADALKSALAHAAKGYCKRNGPMRTIDFESLIDKAPTIDAIPVEWMEEQRDKLSEAWDEEWHEINGLIEQWREEQEANQ